MYNQGIIEQGKVIHPPARPKEQLALLEKIKDGLNCPPLLCFNVILSESHRTKMDLLIIYTEKKAVLIF